MAGRPTDFLYQTGYRLLFTTSDGMYKRHAGKQFISIYISPLGGIVKILFKLKLAHNQKKNTF